MISHPHARHDTFQGVFSKHDFALCVRAILVTHLRQKAENAQALAGGRGRRPFHVATRVARFDVAGTDHPVGQRAHVVRSQCVGLSPEDDVGIVPHQRLDLGGDLVCRPIWLELRPALGIDEFAAGEHADCVDGTSGSAPDVVTGAGHFYRVTNMNGRVIRGCNGVRVRCDAPTPQHARRHQPHRSIDICHGFLPLSWKFVGWPYGPVQARVFSRQRPVLAGCLCSLQIPR